MTEHLQENLTAYCFEELSKEESKQVSNHLIDCLSCRQDYQQFKALQTKLKVLPAIEPSADFMSSVMRSVKEISLAETQADLVLEEMMQKPTTLITTTLPWALVGLLLVSFGGLFLFYNPAASKNEQPKPQIELSTQKIALSKKSVSKMQEKFLEPLADDTIEALIDEYQIDPPFEEFEELDLEDYENPITFSEFDWVQKPNLTLPTSPEFSNEILVPKYPVPSKDHFLKVENNQTVSTNAQKPHWAFAFVHKDGYVGEGSDLTVAFNSLSLVHLTSLQQSLSHQEALIPVMRYLCSFKSQNKFADNMYYCALFTYQLGRLVHFGHKDLLPRFQEASSYLVKNQNADGGWGFRSYPQPDPSNALVTGWAALALYEAQKINLNQFDYSLTKARQFFHRLTDPRKAQCGFWARGDQHEVALSSVFATLVRLTRTDQEKIPQTIEQTLNWISYGLDFQKKQLDQSVDYDFLWATTLLMNHLDGTPDCKEDFELLLIQSDFPRHPSRRGQWPDLTKKLFRELILAQSM